METLLEGKTALVTGATSGIGLASAGSLARLGAQVTIVSRNPEKCATVAGRISSVTGNPVAWIAVDLSTLAGIMQAALTFKQKHARLDILINNAGGFFLKRILTIDGYEMTFALNHLAYFLLTNLLLDMLKASKPARVVCVASESHTGVKHLDFDNLQGEKRYSGFEAYARSKLANILFTYELARHLEGTGVSANALHPGYVNTNIGANNGLSGVFTKYFARWFGRAPEEGARTIIHLAVSPGLERVSGRYFFDCKEIQSSPLTYDQELAKKLWQTSMELTSKDC